jgi:hypothetical protein
MNLLLTVFVTVVVHNLAAIPEATVKQAESTVDHLYRDTGMTPMWTAALDAPDGFTIHVIIRQQPGGGPGSGAPSVAGTTIGDDHARGGVSFVFYDRLATLAHRYNQPVPLILGYAIAHEMGHVLLPAPAHSATGLMKSEWDGDDIRRLTTGAELFTKQQMALIQRAVKSDP